MNARQNGFTLLEVMVAILLMIIVSLIAWRGLESITRTDIQLRESTGHTESVLRALNQLERDVAMRASVELQKPLPGEEPDPQAKTLIPITIRSAERNGMRLDVIRSAATAGEGLQRIRWWLKDNTLYRAAADSSNRYPLPAPDEGIAVLDHAVEAKIRVWRTVGGWQPLDSHREDNPDGLEIVLTLHTRNGDERYRKVLGPLD
ncbi:General secretion pathway protein GspJ [Pseudomonas amygdali pv. morsprunorum]|uniref:PulJ/GspJ family protein n=1 Tax=Pseudomonas amygdali TaxID=47877 RepID=UPI0006B9439B|nr:prepilin-type N-terminal cleavage/methylation domain-containing protein [Pseudomonas amygdali]KPC56511.1 General secretion pathway protein GspJ [Pseudomonas amygdali pv. morsprunorum]PPS24675.1 type II secretion system protein GspJ [Pseudomonas amygdali pv. morsprunorum]